jgi:hypothetical protein
MSNSASVIPTSIDRRKEIIRLLNSIEGYTYVTLEQEDKNDIRKLVQRIKELF